MERAKLSLLWYAVHTRSNFERQLSDEIIRKGLAVFLPTFERSSYNKHHHKKEIVTLPLYRGYTFAQMRETPETRLLILETAGALRILGREGYGEAIPDREIESLQLMVASKQPLKPVGYMPRAGSLIVVKRGPLMGVEGLLMRAKNETRVVVSIDMLGATSAEVDIEDIEVLRQAVAA